MSAMGNILEIRDLRLVRGSGAARKVLVDGVSFTLTAGEIRILEGPSGSGKTTLLWALARMLRPENGELRLEGVSAREFLPRIWRTRVALVLQTHDLPLPTVRQNLLKPYTFRVRRGQVPPDEKTYRRLLDDLGLEDVALDDGADRLSVGQRARISLARSLGTRPAVLLLDEPAAALDSVSAKRVMNRIRAFADEGGAVLMVSHGVEAPRGAVRFRIRDGRLEAVDGSGPPDEGKRGES